MTLQTKITGVVVLGLFLLFGGIALANQKFITAKLHAYHLLPEPETFTELYFTSHLQLPTTVYPKSSISFSFTIHNLEDKNMIYPYEVYLDSNGHKEIIAAKTIAIFDNASRTISEKFTIVSPAPRSEVVVLLKNKNQQIDFWITRGK